MLYRPRSFNHSGVCFGDLMQNLGPTWMNGRVRRGSRVRTVSRDQLKDPQQRHTREQVGYIVFE